MFLDYCVTRLSRNGSTRSSMAPWAVAKDPDLIVFSQLARGTVLSAFAELTITARTTKQWIWGSLARRGRIRGLRRWAGRTRSHNGLPLDKPEFLTTNISHLEPQVPRFSCRGAQVVRDSLTYSHRNRADIVPNLALEDLIREPKSWIMERTSITTLSLPGTLHASHS